MSLKIFIILSIVLGFTYARKLPNYVPVCHRADHDLNKCLKSMIYSFKPHLATGIPELEIPSLEPLHLNNVMESQGLGSKKKLKLSVNNLNINGITDYDVNDVDLDLKENRFKVEITFNNIKFDGDYVLKGKIAGIDIDGAGKMTGNLSKVKAEIRTQYTIQTKNGTEYMHVNDAKLNVSIDDGKIRLANLFPHSKLKTKIAEKMMDKKFKKYARSLAPEIEKKYSGDVIAFCNRLLEVHTFNEMLPL